MSDSESGAREAEMQRLAERERHEKAVGEVLERLRGEKFVRPGERLDLLALEEGAKDCAACCEAATLGDKQSVEERKLQFPGVGDPVSHALEKAGYRVVVDYDMEKSTADVDCLRYSLFEKEK